MNLVSLLFSFVLKGTSGLVSYGLGKLNSALAKMNPRKQAHVTAALNIAQRVLSSLIAFKWACPTKWQNAYGCVIEAVADIAGSLSDLVLTDDEVARIIEKGKQAYDAWESADDETCVDTFEKGVD